MAIEPSGSLDIKLLVKGAQDKGYIEVQEIEDKGFGLIRRLAERKKASGMARSE